MHSLSSEKNSLRRTHHPGGAGRCLHMTARYIVIPVTEMWSMEMENAERMSESIGDMEETKETESDREVKEGSATRRCELHPSAASIKKKARLSTN